MVDVYGVEFVPVFEIFASPDFAPWDLDAAEEKDFCEEVCANPADADTDTIFDCGCNVFDFEDDFRSDLEQASDWLASAGMGTDEDYGF